MSTSAVNSPTPDISSGNLSLAEHARLVESEIADLYRHVRQVRAAFDEAVKGATLRSREQAAEILQASTAQLDRWAASGKLRPVYLDRRPRYRLPDLEAFAVARLQPAGSKGSTEPPRKT